MRRLNITPELKNLINTLRARLLRSYKILKRLFLSGIITGEFATEDVFRKITQTLKQFADLTDSEFIAQREQIHNFLVQTRPFIADFRDHCKSSTELNAADFFFGLAVIQHCQEIYTRTKQNQWLEQQIHAVDCWAHAVFAVVSHYHSSVGPAMLAVGETMQAQGRSSDAQGIYDAVISDFAFFVDEYENEIETEPSADELLAMQYLNEALQRQIALKKVVDQEYQNELKLQQRLYPLLKNEHQHS